MLYFYIKSFLSSIKKNKFFYSVNLIGFLTGFLVLIVILTFVYQELSFDKFHAKAIFTELILVDMVLLLYVLERN